MLRSAIWLISPLAAFLIGASTQATAFTYDANGLVQTITETDTTTQSVPYSTNGQTRVWTFTYTTASGVKQLTSVDGPRTDVSDTTAYQYTAAGYLSRITNAVGHQSNVTSHDGMGRPLSITDANGVVTDLEYNARGWLTKSTVRHGTGDAVTLIEYSLAGDVTKVTLPDSSFLTYTYDDARRLIAIANQLGEKIEFTYDLASNVTQQVTKDAGGTIKRTQTRAYDELSRLLRTVGAATQTTSFGYDNNSNLTSLTDPLNKSTGFGFDALNRLITTTNPLMGVRNTGYDPQDNVTSESDERSIATAYVYNGFGEVIQEASPDGGTIVYVRDSAGNVTQKTDARGQVVQYSYDALNPVTAATFSGAPSFNITYSYDATDNRLTRNLSGGPSETFTYGTTNNRLQSAAVTGQPTRTFTSNAAGDITLDDRGAGNTVTIAIGADGRPQTITVAGAGATTVSYKHNAFGERVSRVEGAATTHFDYDLDGKLIAESDGAGAVIREYLWLGPKPVGLVVGPAASATLYYVHADHLDRVQKITDASQTIVWDGQFTPYGRTHAIAGTLQNPLRLPGQWADPAASYFYNYMRDYDPTLARYLSVDPIGTGGGRNKFGYAGANPQNFIDPSGKVLQGWLFAAGGALAAHFALEFAIQRLEHKCGEFAFDWNRAFRTAPYALLFGLVGKAISVARAGIGLAGAFGALGSAASRAAPTLSGRGVGAMTTLYRAVNQAELASIQRLGQFISPYGIEGKYFSTTLEGAAREAQLLGRADKGAYTVVQSSFPSNAITPIMQATADINVPTVVIPTNLLNLLTKSTILNYVPR